MTAKYEKWNPQYGKNWQSDTMGVNAHIMKFQFDGGIKHKDGTSWAITRMLPGVTLLDVRASSKGIAGVTFDLGTVGYDRDCKTCEPLCCELTALAEGIDLSAAGCKQIICSPWDCGDSCLPDCCGQMPAEGCCPPDEETKCCGHSDLILTLHGTPPACSQFDLVFMYMMTG